MHKPFLEKKKKKKKHETVWLWAMGDVRMRDQEQRSDNNTLSDVDFAEFCVTWQICAASFAWEISLFS